MSLLRRLFRGKGAAPAADTSIRAAPETRRYTAQDLSLLEERAINLMRQVNESAQLAHNSTNPDTKVSRLELCKTRLEQLRVLADEHPRITITNLDGMLQTIARLESEFTAAGFYAQSNAVDANFRAQAVVRSDLDEAATSWKFSAVLQLRTPLRILQRHGEIIQRLPDDVELVGLHQGVWLPLLPGQTKFFGTMSSDVGPIPADGGDYLHFLLAVRHAVEADAPAKLRLTSLRAELSKPAWRDFCVRLGGNEAIYGRFFPKFLDTVPGLPSTTVEHLWERSWTTPARLDSAADEELLNIKGIGPAKLRAIRQACLVAADPHSDIVDAVER